MDKQKRKKVGRIILITGKENLRLGKRTLGNRINIMKYNEMEIHHQKGRSYDFPWGQL